MFRDKQRHKRGHKRQNSGKVKIVHEDTEDFKKYTRLLQTFEKHEKIVIVLDARAPQAGRYPTFESLMSGKIIFCLNKIDLIPREITLGWISYLSKIAPTVALSAKDSADALISYLKENNVKDICITGLKSMGKRTLASKLGELSTEITDNWEFMTHSFEHLILNSVEKLRPREISEYMSMFLERCSSQSVMEVFGFTYSSASLILLKENNTEGAGSPKELLESIQNGRFIFYTPPPTITYDSNAISSLSDTQKVALKSSHLMDSIEKPYIVLIEGEIVNVMKPSLLKELKNKI